jgi:hypothetical protein
MRVGEEMAIRKSATNWKRLKAGINSGLTIEIFFRSHRKKMSVTHPPQAALTSASRVRPSKWKLSIINRHDTPEIIAVKIKK